MTMIPTQVAHDDMGMSPEGLLKVLASRTYREPSRDSQGKKTKIYDSMQKLFSRCNIP